MKKKNKVKIPWKIIIFACLILAGAGVAIFVPFNTVIKAVSKISAPVKTLFTPDVKKPIPTSIKPSTERTAAPRTYAPAPKAVDTSKLLDLVQRILGLGSVLVTTLVAVKSLKKKPEAAPAAPEVVYVTVPTPIPPKKEPTLAKRKSPTAVGKKK